jgi:NADH:ubiquinone oxidoreductase subunit 2 (subunit N)
MEQSRERPAFDHLLAFPGGFGHWPEIIAVLTALTMTVGTLFALPQTRVKRLLPYSSIAQAGSGSPC